MNVIDPLVQKTKTYFCLDCGVCTGSCPVSRVTDSFSPRLIVERSLYELERLDDETIWSCLTCARCSERCPANIDFPEFIRLIRDEAQKTGLHGMPAHNGMLQTIMAMHSKDIHQNRTSWVDGNVSEDSDTFYFVGCRPYFDVIFRDIRAGSIQGARNTLRLLNLMGVEPTVSNEERCCGHDALWNGNQDLFMRLARRNIDLIRSSGAKQVVFSCPEGYHTFKHYYSRYFGELGFEVVHIVDLLSRKIKENGISFKPLDEVVTYQDPCRLGRMAGIYDAPREIIRSIPGLTFKEMERNRESAVCCGTSAWQNCSSYSRTIQLDRLKEAGATGAGTVITSCPKCAIHFNCTVESFELEIRIKELLDLVAEQAVIP